MQFNQSIKIWSLSVLLLAACDPMHDIDKALDAQEELERAGGNSNFSKALTYTMVEADYKSISKAALAAATNASDSALAKAVATQQAFNSWATSTQFAPALLKSLYPGLGNGSSVVLTANYVTTPPLLVQNLNGISSYTLSSSDYPNSAINWFSPTSQAGDYLPAILKKQFPEASEGTYYLAFYNYSTGETTLTEKLTSFFSEDFESDYADKSIINQHEWSQYLAKGAFQWQTRTFSGNLYAQFSSFGSKEANEAWLITPEIDLKNVGDAVLTFKAKYRYVIAGHQALQVKVSSNYLGDASQASWVDITNGFTFPTAETPALEKLDNYPLNKFKDQKIRIAFVYVGDGTSGQTTTVQIDDVEVQKIQQTAVSSSSIFVKNALYQYNGTAWGSISSGKLDADATVSTPIYALQSTDYNEMGESGPGARDNFSSSLLPNNYLPQFLALKYPYAQIGNQIVVIYQYYGSGKLSNQAALYTYGSSSVWEPFSTIQIKEEQYVNNGKGWLFDPTITFTLVSTDYQAIVNWVADNVGEDWLDYRYKEKKNAEMWCGASAYYANMDFTLSLRRNALCDPTGSLANLSDDQCEDLFQKRITEQGLPAVLKARYPEMPAMTSGVPQYYQVSYLVYPSRVYYMTKYKGLGNGEFEYVEGPTAQ